MPLNHAISLQEVHSVQSWIPILSTQTLVIAGRCVHFARIVIEILNQMTAKSIDVIISRFETQTLSEGISECKLLLEIAKHTHESLQAYIDLNEFSSILNQVDERIGPFQSKGRLQNLILNSLVFDIIPNYCYQHETQRYFLFFIVQFGVYN